MTSHSLRHFGGVAIAPSTEENDGRQGYNFPTGTPGEIPAFVVLNHRNDLPIEKQSDVLNESIYTRGVASMLSVNSSGVWLHDTVLPPRG